MIKFQSDEGPYKPGAHERRNMECPVCYRYPDTCFCGGLVHIEYMDENWDGPIFERECDDCGK